MSVNDRLLALYRRKSSVVPVGIDSGAKAGQYASHRVQKSRFRVERIPLLPDQVFKYYGIGGSDDEEESRETTENKPPISKAYPAPKGGMLNKGRGSSAHRKSDSQSQIPSFRCSLPPKELFQSTRYSSELNTEVTPDETTFNQRVSGARRETIPSFRCSLPPKELFQSTRQSSELNTQATQDETALSERVSSGGSETIPSFRCSLPPKELFQSTIYESDCSDRRSKRESQGSSQSAASSAPSTPVASQRRQVFAPRSLNKRTQTEKGDERQEAQHSQLPNFSFKPSDHNLTLSPANRTAGNARNESTFPSFRLSIGRASLFQSTLYNDNTCHLQGISMLNVVDVSGSNTNTSTNTGTSSTPVRPLRRTDVSDYNNWDEGLLTPDSERRQQSAELSGVDTSPAEEIVIPEQVSPIKKVWSQRVIDCRTMQPAPVPERAVGESPKQRMPFYLSHRKAVEDGKPANDGASLAAVATVRQQTSSAPLKSAMKRPPTQSTNTKLDGALKEICMNYGSPSPVEDVQNRRKSRISFYEPHKVLNDSESLCTTTVTAGAGKSPVNSPPAKSFKHTNQSAAMSPPAGAAPRRRSSGMSPTSPLVCTTPTDSPVGKRKSLGGGRKPEASLERRIHMSKLIAKAAGLTIGSSESGGSSSATTKSTTSSPPTADWMPKSGRVVRKMQPKFEKRVYPEHLFERKPVERDSSTGPHLFSDDGNSSEDASFLSIVTPMSPAQKATKPLVSSDQTWFNYGSDYEDAMDTSVPLVAEVPNASDYVSEGPEEEQPSCITHEDLEDVRKDTTLFSQNVTDHANTPGQWQLESPASLASGAASSNASSSVVSVETPPGAMHIVAANEAQHQPSPVLVFKEPKIIAPNTDSPSVAGLRRSERNRLPRLDPHYQRPIYHRDETGNDVLVGVESHAVWDRLLKKHRVTDHVMAAERERDRIHHKRLEKKRQEEFRKRRFRT